jgi:hypothetical protein
LIGALVEGQPTTGEAGAWLHTMGDTLVEKHPNLDAKVVEVDMTALEILGMLVLNILALCLCCWCFAGRMGSRSTVKHRYRFSKVLYILTFIQ